MDGNTQWFLIVAGGFVVVLLIQYIMQRPGRSTVQGNPDEAVFVYDGVEYDVDERTDLNRFEFDLKLKHQGRHVNTVTLTDDEVVPLRPREAIVPSPGMRRRWIRRAERDRIVRDLAHDRNKVIAELAGTYVTVEVDGTEHKQRKYSDEEVEERAWSILYNRVAACKEEIIDLENRNKEVNNAFAAKSEELTNKIINQNEERKEFVTVATDVLKAKAAGTTYKPK